MEKKTPHCKLSRVKELIEEGKVGSFATKRPIDIVKIAHKPRMIAAWRRY